MHCTTSANVSVCQKRYASMTCERKLRYYVFLMKLTALLTLLFMLQASAYSYGQRIELRVKNATLESVLKSLQEQSGYNILFNNKYLKNAKRVTLNIQAEDINEALIQVFKGQPYDFRVKDKMVTLVPADISPETSRIGVEENAVLQQAVSGHVTDSLGTPIVGVTVQVSGTSRGTTTDGNGAYRLNASQGEILIFRNLGYVTKEVVITEQQVINVVLQEQLAGIDEVVVIGYGQRARKDITTAISSISSSEIEQTVSMSPEMAMQGRMAGVQVAGNTGNPMMRPTIRIRGVNTWGVSSPLYVIDGIPVTEFGAGIEGQEDARAADLRGPLNVMTLLNPDDIESISVLKDASAAAIYGVRAANGVILITTKQGRSDRPSVNFTARAGIQRITAKNDLLNTPQFVEHTRKVFASDPTVSIAPENEGLFDPSSSNYLGNSPTYDWQEAILNKNAPTQDYSLRISGGTAKTDYYLSGGYSSMEGTLIGSSLSRYNGAFNLNSRLNDWVKVGVNYRLTSARGEDRGLDFNDMALTPPWQPIYDPNGLGGFASVVTGMGDDGVYRSDKRFGSGTRINRVGQIAVNDQYYESLRNMGSGYVEISPIENLSIKGQISIDNYITTRYEFTDYRANAFDYTRGDPRALGGGESVGSYGEREVLNRNIVKELTVNYRKTFGDHTVDLLFNGMEQQYSSKAKVASTEQMLSTSPDLRNLGGERDFTEVSSMRDRWALAGLLGRVGYNYQSKYYLDLTLRRDGSARFAPENRWGWFPAFSAAWRVTEEDFGNNIGWLNDFKLRVGWGKLGNQEVRNLAYLSPIEINPTFAWGDNPNRPGYGYYSTSAVVFNLANTNLRWESTATTNIGFDAVLFQHLSVTAEYYDKLTDGILQTVSLPGSVGLVQQPVDNVASVRNSGFEFVVGYNGQVGDVSYGISANLTTVRNRVVSTYEDIPLWNIERGYPLFYQRGYKQGGMFQTQAEVDAWLAKYQDANYQVAKVAPGDFYFEDLRGAPKNEGEFYSEGGDGRIDDYDQVYLGKTIPGFFYGGTINLGWKNLDLDAQFTGVGDVVKHNALRNSLEYTAAGGQNLSTRVLNSWSPENPSSTMPRIMNGDPAGNFRGSDYFVENASYLRLANLQIGYTLPQSAYTAFKGNLSNLRVYTGGSNLFTVTKYTGLDPESDVYPMPRVFFLGLSARF